MDRQKIKDIRAAVEEALEAAGLGEQFGVSVQTKRATYDDTMATLKVQFSDLDDEGVAQTPERMDFIRRAESYGLSPDDLDEEFNHAGQRFTIVGLNTRARKYPVIGRAKDGRRYKFPVSTVKAMLEMERARKGN